MAEKIEPCLSVVMPCFNEAGTIGPIVERVLASPWTAELIVVDDGSTDGTREVLAQVDDRRVSFVLQPTNRGKGAALRRGFAQARSPYVIIQDADEEYDPDDYGVMLEPLLDGRADVVYGSRFHTARPHRVLYFWHSVGNLVLTTLSNMFTNLNLSDMETCYKAFRREVLDTFEIEEDRFGFEPEITAKLARGGWRIYEVSISYAGRTYAEGKKIGWRDGVHALWCIVRYSALIDKVAPRSAGRVGSGPVAFDEADEELAETLHSLDHSVHYADWIFSLIEPHLGTRVLEVGAGHGTFTERLLSGRTVTATELSPRCLAVLRERFRSTPQVEIADVLIQDSGALGEFDSAVLVNVLEHIEDDRGALRHLATALRPGGRVVLFVPAFEALYSEFDRRVGHHRRYGKGQLEAAVEAAGLTVVESRYVNSLGALAWWLVARQLGRTPTNAGLVLVYDRSVVPVLRRVEAVWRPPFGQSLLCIAARPDGVTTQVDQAVGHALRPGSHPVPRG